MGQPRFGVAQEFRANGAQTRTAAMPGAAENPEHRRHGAALTFEARLHGGNYRTTSRGYNGGLVLCCGRGTGRSSAAQIWPQIKQRVG